MSDANSHVMSLDILVPFVVLINTNRSSASCQGKVFCTVESIMFFPRAQEQVLPCVVSLDANVMYCFIRLEHPLEPGLKHHPVFVIPSAIEAFGMFRSPNKYVPIFGQQSLSIMPISDRYVHQYPRARKWTLTP